METLAARNPVALRALHEIPLAPRPASLEGQTLGLWWNLKEGGNSALERIGAALEKRFGVKLYRAYSAYPGPKALIESTAREATVVIGSTGD